MGNVAIYHPDSQGIVSVPEESVWHYRQGGWLTMDEWQDHQVQDAARAAAAEKVAEAETARTSLTVKPAKPASVGQKES